MIPFPYWLMTTDGRPTGADATGAGAGVGAGASAGGLGGKDEGQERQESLSSSSTSRVGKIWRARATISASDLR